MPHSDIRGSKLVRSSPRLFAAYHVLHSLRMPRHPPNALKALDRSHFQCPPVPGPAPGWKRVLRDETNGILRPIAEQTMGRNPSPHEPRTETGLRKTSVTRELPVGGALKHRQLSLIRPSFKGQDVRTTLLFTMSKCRPKGRQLNQKTEVSRRNFLRRLF